MVIRRIREHVATHNWFAVSIDLLIVVAGIVIGTQVNNWNQARIDRAQGKEYRERLTADLRSNETEMLDRRSYYATVRRHAVKALALIERPAGKDGREFLFSAYQASQIIPRKSKRFTYDELVSTGRIAQLGEANLRESIANYYMAIDTARETFAFVAPYREHIRQIMPNAAQQAIREQCAETFSFTPDGATVAKLPMSCSLKLDPAAVTSVVSAVRSSPTIVTDLNRQIADHDIKLALIEQTIRQARDLRAVIAKVQSP